MQFLIALGLGVLSAFAFAPFALWPLMPLAFAALCHVVTKAARLRSALAIGWGFGVGQFAVGLNWIATAFTFQAAMPAWLGWIAVVLLSLYLAVYPMLAVGLAWRFGRERPVALVLALAGGWSITEWLRATMFTGFAWNPVGVTLADTPMLGLSGLVGTYGLSAVVVLFGGAVWLATLRQWRSVAAMMVVPLLALAWPTSRVPDGSTTIRPIRIVQPNIGQQDKWREGFAAVAARRLDGLSLNGAQPDVPKLVFWPEAAVTEPLLDQRAGMPSADAAMVRRRAAASLMSPSDRLLTGGLGLLASDGRRISGAVNSVFVLGPGGVELGRYDKAHLVPYGEYLPMRPLLSAIGLSRLAPGDIDFVPGPGPRTLNLAGWGKVGFQLCYEIIFSGAVVDRSDRPSFIFNPSNDAWFGAWGPPQHLAQSRLRAAEEGLPVIRSTPTGISALVDARGHVVASIPLGQAGVIDGALPLPSTVLSPFALLGNVIPLALGFVLLIAAIALGRRRRYSAT